MFIFSLLDAHLCYPRDTDIRWIRIVVLCVWRSICLLQTLSISHTCLANSLLLEWSVDITINVGAISNTSVTVSFKRNNKAKHIQIYSQTFTFWAELDRQELLSRFGREKTRLYCEFQKCSQTLYLYHR